MLFTDDRVKTDKLRIATSSLTSLIIKWLEGKKEHYGEFDRAGRNQLITELIGEVR